MDAALILAGAYLTQLWLKTGLALSVRAREPIAPSAALNRLTVIQPVVSGDAALGAVLEKNLHELRGVATIWIIDRSDDAARLLCHALQRRHPANEILVLETDEPPMGLNPKMWKQLAALPAVRSELLAVIDDDTWTPRRSVDALISALDAGADLATGLPSYVAAPGIWSSLVAEFVNSSAILTYLSAAACVEPLSINGMCYALHTAFVRDHGIFDTCASATTDDLAVAKAVRRHGRIVQTSQPQQISTSVATFVHYRRLLHRWFVFTRLLVQNESRPTQAALLVAYGLHPALLIALFILAPAHPGPLIVVLLARALTLSLLNRRLVGAWRHAPLTSVIAELVQPLFFLGAFFHPVIWWRRRKIRVHAFNRFDYLSPMNQHFTIIGSSRALPARVVSAQELDHRLGLTPGWTAGHTGVLSRHQTAGPAEAEALVRQVCFAALAEAGRTLADLELIVDASLCIQQPIPCNAALVQKILGPAARGIPCFDVHASCLGFLAALTVVNGLFAAGTYRRAMIVCAETPTVGVNWNEPESACLMGDGAAAFVLEAGKRDTPSCFLFETYAEGARLCEITGGGLRLPATAYTDEQRSAFQFHMDGKAVHKLASQRFPALLEKALALTGHRLDELQIVPHQASGPALEFMRRRLGMAEDRFHVSVAEHGNMVAASIPFVLDRVRRRWPRGTPIMACGTAAGYSQAAAIFAL